jgi:chromosome segregation protein
MNESRLKLQKVVNELTAVMRTQFMEQFEIIRKNFSQVFSELFGGGKADIVLAEGEDVLECGIDINVQPPGKKLQNMMLLSGGERALTAIALLFGILRMRPSPFCLLDEIEAALDDANVYRLSDYLDTVAKNTQFIMVTHRKGTMENAESLYGVTMEEKGVSKVVSLKI